METVTPFAQTPDSPEPIIAQVLRDLIAQSTDVTAQMGVDLDLVAETAVRELWGSRVKTFVSVLALRQAREVLGIRGAPLTEPSRDTAALRAPASGRSERDVLHVDHDVFRIAHDVQRRND